jgi:UDP-N-acetylmuramate dehydrogenase
MLTQIRGKIAYKYSIKKHNSWRVGGAVKCCFWPADLADLQVFLTTLPADERIIFLGLGSNVLFPDGLLDATVIITVKGLGAIRVLDDHRLYVECGVSCAKVAKQSVQMGFADGAFFSGIPGSMGGALRMNAGAFGGETWRVVESVNILSRSGTIETVPANSLTVAYRHVELPDQGWFVSGNLAFQTPAVAGPDPISTLLKKRNHAQPIGSFSCGSVFKNPIGQFAAALIDQCGLKGMRIGDAVVSLKHANFIVNEGAATAADVSALMRHVQQVVAEQYAVWLEPEVKIYQHEG